MITRQYDRVQLSIYSTIARWLSWDWLSQIIKLPR